MESLSEQISLTEALSEARIPTLPDEWSNKNIHWAMAIVKVRKNNMRVNYAIAENDGEDKPIIIKDFGSSAKIVEILEIRPYAHLNDAYIPDLRNKQDIKHYLIVNGVDEQRILSLLSTKNDDGSEKSEEEKKADRSLIKKMVVRFAVINQVENANMRNNGRRNDEGFEKEENTDLV